MDKNATPPSNLVPFPKLAPYQGRKNLEVPLTRGIRGLYYFLCCYRLFLCHKHINLKKEKEPSPMGFSLDLGLKMENEWLKKKWGPAGFQSFIGFNAKKNKGVVALTNSSIHWIAPLSFEILALQSLSYS